MDYVVENGGHDGTGNGKIQMLPIGEAFETDAHFVVVSPPKDSSERSTRYMLLQRALASLGVQYEYHMRSVSCETFAVALLEPINDSFGPIQTGLIRSHRKDLPEDAARSQWEKDEQKYQTFHQTLLNRMKDVPKGIILTLEFLMKVDPGLLLRGSPWFKEMQNCYEVFWDCCRRGDAAGCTREIEKGLNVDSKTNDEGVDGTTGLMIAAKHGHDEVITVLLNQGAEARFTDDEGNTALNYYLETPNLRKDTLAWLVKITAPTDTTDINTALDAAAKDGNVDLVTALLDHADDAGKNSALHSAAGAGQEAVLETLLDAGIEPNMEKVSATLRGYSKIASHQRRK